MSTQPPVPRSSTTRSRGRGAAAAFGFILLFAGLIGGGVMYVMSLQRHDEAVDGFARAVVGCTTTLEFTETGTFFVYEETAGSFEIPEGGCQPQATPGASFEVAFVTPDAVELVTDASIDYETDEFTGSSVSRFEIDQPGNYELQVSGDDASVRAAIGRDPSSGVDDLRRGAIIVAAAGVLLGGLLLALAGRRSKRAATPSIPDGPGWGQRPGQGEAAWPPQPPRLPQVPVNPQQPDTPAAVAAPPPPLPARAPGSAAPTRSPWAPPTPDAEPVDTAPPAPVEGVKPPELPPKLPQ
jgi:hypothetical protein